MATFTKSLLDQIVQVGGSRGMVFNNYAIWANGKEGSISDHKNNNIFRFFLGERRGNGHDIVYTSYEDSPIVAKGIIAYWLHHRKNNDPYNLYNRLASIDVTGIQKQFVDYTNQRLREYIDVCEQDIYCLHKDWTAEFYTRYIIPEERRNNKETEALYEYITPSDCKVVRKIMSKYILFLKEKLNIYKLPVIKPKRKDCKTPVRVVDINRIGQHFIYSFDKRTYLPTFKLLLELPKSDKNLARVALLIYESRWFLKNDYKTFISWYKDFCNIVGCSFHKSYTPSALKPIPKQLVDSYYFL
ncbi:MAG: hypothetical protein J5630_07625 [Bacteroidaceae bacterium]|nr:hypothetical protein [Bacteroidaceae bacterium]